MEVLPRPFVFEVEYVTITPAYSNAALHAILPLVSEFARKAELSVPLPITTNHVARFSCDPHRGKVGGGVRLTSGYVIRFEDGHVTAFEAPTAYFWIQDPKQVPKFLGPVRISHEEALVRVRLFIAKIGYSLEELFAVWEPEVHEGGSVDGKPIPRVQFEWLDPRWKTHSAQFEVNLETGNIEQMSLLNRNLDQPPPKIDVEPGRGKVIGGRSPLKLGRPYAAALLPHVFREAIERTSKMGMAPPFGWSISDVAEWDGSGTNEWAHISVRLSDGWRLYWRNGVLVGADAPDAFFSNTGALRITDYMGKWRVGVREAKRAARESLRAAGYSLEDLGMEREPSLRWPYFKRAAPVPRVQVIWEVKSDDYRQPPVRALVEYDTGTKQVKAFRVDSPKLRAPLPEIVAPMHADASEP